MYTSGKWRGLGSKRGDGGMITTGEAAAQPIRIERQDLGFEMGETFLCTGGSFVLLQNVKGTDSPQLQDGIDDPEGQMEIVADPDLELVRDLDLVCPQKGVSRVLGHNGLHCRQDNRKSMGRAFWSGCLEREKEA